MSRTLIWRLLFPTLCFTVAWAQHPPLGIGSCLELFVDGYLIDSMEGVNLMFQEPQSAGNPFECRNSTNSLRIPFQEVLFGKGEVRRASLEGDRTRV